MSEARFTLTLTGAVCGRKVDAAKRLEFFQAHLRQWQETRYPDIILDLEMALQIHDFNGEESPCGDTAADR